MKNLLTSILLLVSSFFYAQKPIFTTGKVKSATVYFNAAEITQTANVNLPVGTQEIVIKNVANYLNESSIQIGAPSSITVLSVQFTNDYISEFEIDESNPEIKKVKDSITLVEKELQKVINTKNSEAKTVELLDKNQQIAGQNSSVNVAELIKLVDFYKAKRTEITNNINNLLEREQKLNELLEKLNNKLEIDTSKEEKASEGKLVIQVMNEIAGNVPLEISYLTTNAGWTPFYDLRANSVAEPIDMMYKAQVVQNTGIDWKKVKLTLSSGMPNQNNQAPTVNPWFLRYQPEYRKYDDAEEKIGYTSTPGMAVANQSIQANYNGVADLVDKKTSRIVLRGTRSKAENNETLIVIDGVISSSQTYAQLPKNSIKGVNVIKGEQATSLFGEQGSNGAIVVTTKQMDDYTTISESQLNVTFDIDIPYDILSNGKKHSVSLKEIKLPATYKYYAAPKLDKEAFLLAEITDYGKYNLLKGEANIIFEGMYVGKTMVNPNQTSDTLNLSMGRDKKVSIKREKVVDKSGTKFLSSKKEQTFTYDIIIRNNKKEAVSMKLEDQYPLSTDKEIEVELKEKDGAKVNTETGILTWELDLKPNETKKIRLSYSIKYPKNKVIDNL